METNMPTPVALVVIVIIQVALSYLNVSFWLRLLLSMVAFILASIVWVVLSAVVSRFRTRG